MRLCRRCIEFARRPSRQYSAPAGEVSKWARPPPSKWARPDSIPPPEHRRSSHETSRGNSMTVPAPAVQRQREDQRQDEAWPAETLTSETSGNSTTSADEPRRHRTYEEVREDLRLRKQAREEKEASQRLASSNGAKTRFSNSPTTPSLDSEPSRWALKKLQDKARMERQAQVTSASQVAAVKKRKPKSAHLQEVKSQLYIPQSISVVNLSKLLNVRLERLQHIMVESGFENNAHDYVLTADVATLLAEEFNFKVIVDDTSSFDLYAQPMPTDTSTLPMRPPFVTIMGHVDHGKTTLLDTLRKSSVAAKEAGGITQHIGAFSVKLPGGKQITFLDTPGHAAFESMRQRGASVTDIVVLVVAADDSVMPQTKEAIKHALNAKVNMIVAINKTDKPGVDVEKVKRDLMAHGVEVEDFGGDIQSVAVSGLTGKGLDNLESAIVSLAEILDIRAEAVGIPEGWVIESSVKKGRGNVASMIVKRGTIKTGTFIVAGKTWCKVRAMTDEAGKTLRTAGPGTPVEVTGWSVLPVAGDEVLGASSEKEAKQVVSNRILRAEQIQQLSDIEAINEKRLKEREDALKAAAVDNAETTNVSSESQSRTIEVPFIVKGDVSGSVEAVMDSIVGIGNDEVRTKLIDSGVGEVSESDVLRAAASSGKIVAFNVPIDNKAKATAAREGIQILSHNIIYRLIDDVRDTLAGFLEPIRQQKVLGEAEILKIFSINTKGRESKNIAGCRVTNGTINRAEQIRISRKKEVVYEGKLAVFKQVKQDIQTLGKGNDCGMEFESFQDFQEGDTIQCFTTEEIKRTL